MKRIRRALALLCAVLAIGMAMPAGAERGHAAREEIVESSHKRGTSGRKKPSSSRGEKKKAQGTDSKEESRRHRPERPPERASAGTSAGGRRAAEEEKHGSRKRAAPEEIGKTGLLTAEGDEATRVQSAHDGAARRAGPGGQETGQETRLPDGGGADDALGKIGEPS